MTGPSEKTQPLVKPRVDRWELTCVVGYILTKKPTPVLEVLVGNAQDGWTNENIDNFVKMELDALEAIRSLAASEEIEIWGQDIGRRNSAPVKIDPGFFFHKGTVLVQQLPRDGQARGMVIVNGKPRFLHIYVTVDDSVRTKLWHGANKLNSRFLGFLKQNERAHLAKQKRNKADVATEWVKSELAHQTVSLRELERRWGEFPSPKSFTRLAVRNAYMEYHKCG
jgi:hypothetical protein